MNINKHKSFKHLSSSTLIAYHQRQLDAHEEHNVERHLLDCDLCSEALRGLEKLPDAGRMYKISNELKRRNRHSFSPSKKIFGKMDLLVLLALLFVLGIILLLAYFLLILKK